MKALWEKLRLWHDYLAGVAKFTLAAILAILAISGLGLGWVDADDQLESRTYQYFGMPCSRLVDLSKGEVKALIHHRNREHFRNFCRPEDLLNCSDYNVYLYDLGNLKGHDGATCQFISTSQ